MATKEEIVTVNKSYVENVLAKMPSDPTLRQTIHNLERISKCESKILERGTMAKPDFSGDAMYYVRLVPTQAKVPYRAPYDGPSTGIIIYFYSKADRDGALVAVSP